MTRTKGLTRGARASFYRDGHELVSACDIPTDGAFAVRDLQPGQYVARDSCGGEQAFTVTVHEEVTVILPGEHVGATGGPGLSGAAAVPALNVGGGHVITTPDQVAAEEPLTGAIEIPAGEAPAEVAAPVPDAELAPNRPDDPGAEVRVAGQPGAPFVLEAPIRSVAETREVARERGKLHERNEEGELVPTEARFDREVEDLERAEETPRTTHPGDVGPAPERPTLPPWHEDAE